MSELTSRQRQKIVLGVLLVAGAVLAAWAYYPKWRSNRIAHAERREAVYKDLRIYGYPNFVKILTIEPRDTELYVEMPDRTVYLVKDIPESALERDFRKLDTRKDPIFPSNQVIYQKGDSILSYIGGELTLASFHFDQGFRFGRKKTGPFVRLPFGDEELLSVFGEPLSWEVPGPSGPSHE